MTLINKGLQIRNNKRKKQAKKRNSIKPEQKGLCRFIKIKYETFSVQSGKIRHSGTEDGYGLQIENKIYLLDGHHKMLNSKNVIIKKEYKGIPSWVNESLKEKYNATVSTFLQK